MDSRSRDGDSGALLSHRGGGGGHSAAAALHAHAHPAAAHPAADPDAAMLDGWLAHGGAHAHSQSGFLDYSAPSSFEGGFLDTLTRPSEIPPPAPTALKNDSFTFLGAHNHAAEQQQQQQAQMSGHGGMAPPAAASRQPVTVHLGNGVSNMHQQQHQQSYSNLGNHQQNDALPFPAALMAASTAILSDEQALGVQPNGAAAAASQAQQQQHLQQQQSRHSSFTPEQHHASIMMDLHVDSSLQPLASPSASSATSSGTTQPMATAQGVVGGFVDTSFPKHPGLGQQPMVPLGYAATPQQQGLLSNANSSEYADAHNNMRQQQQQQQQQLQQQQQQLLQQQQQQQSSSHPTDSHSRHQPLVRHPSQHSTRAHLARQASQHQQPAADSMADGEGGSQLPPQHDGALRRGMPNDQRSVGSVSSAASSPDVHLQSLRGDSARSSERSSNHTSPLVSSPQSPSNQPASPTPLVPTSPPTMMIHRGSGHNSRSSTSNGGSGALLDAVTPNVISTSGLVSTLQSSHDLLLNVHLQSGSGKKKSWPSRVISLQSMHNAAVSYSQLLFHAANISTFASVSVDGKEVSDALEAGVSVQSSLAVRQRLEQVAQALAQGYAAGGKRQPWQQQRGSQSRSNSGNDNEHEHSGNSTGSYRSTPSHYSSALDLPPLDITYQLADNVKSCTRLGCLNLLVNKANRRACNVCQSQGAEISATLLRRLIISPHHSAPQYAYLEQILEDFEFWRFSAEEGFCQRSDAGDDGSSSSAAASQQVGFYIAFVDANTAAHVQKDFNHKLGFSAGGGSGGSGEGGAPASAMCEVDTSFSYAIKMKSHFWMLEVKPRAPADSDGSSNGKSKVKSKFFKKVGKPNQSRASAAAALAAQQQAQNGGGYMVPFKTEPTGPGSTVTTPLQHKRRFDEGDMAGQQVNQMLHINHININMPGMSALQQQKMMQAAAAANMLPDGNAALHGNGGNGGGATIEVLDEPTTNSVHVSDNAFRVMKNQPVNAMLNVHSADDGAAAASASAHGGSIESRPLAAQPTPVVLVYRDVDAYQRDMLMNGGGMGGNGNGNGNGQNSGGGGGGGFSNNDGGFNNGGQSNNSSNKRGRFDGPSGNNNNNNGNNNNNNNLNMNAANFNLASMATPALGLGGLTPSALGALNSASMAGVAAAVNQFQYVQAAQAQQLQQQLFQQVAMDYGRFQAPWVYQDMSAAAVAQRANGGGQAQQQPVGGTAGDVELMPLGDAQQQRQAQQRGARRTSRRERRSVDSHGNVIDTFDEGERDVYDDEKEDGSTLDGDSTYDGESQSAGSAVRRPRPLPRKASEHDSAVDDNSGSGDVDEESLMSVEESVNDSRNNGAVAAHAAGHEGLSARYGQAQAPVAAHRIGAVVPNVPVTYGKLDREAAMSPEHLLLVEDVDGRARKAPKPVAAGMQQQPLDFNGQAKSVGPCASFFRSFHSWQQSVWGTLLTMALGVVAIIILSHNLEAPELNRAGNIADDELLLLSFANDPGHSNKVFAAPVAPAADATGKIVRPLMHQASRFYSDDQEGDDAVASPILPILRDALAVGPARSRLATAAVSSTSNSTDSDVVTRRLAASIQLFLSMREASAIYNVWAASAPVAVANMLNPPPGTPAVVNVDVIAGNCNQGVKIARAVGDYVLASNGLLAAFSAFGTPSSFAATSTSSQLCSTLTTGEVGGIWMFHLTCTQWLKSNGLAIPLPSPLTCASTASAFNSAFKLAQCVELMDNIASANMTNAFFLPYNTSVADSSNPTVYAAGGPTSDVQPSALPVGSSSSPNEAVNSKPLAAPLNDAALAALNALPHLGALAFYSQAAVLHPLCINFNVVTALVSQLASPAGSTTGGTTGGATTDTGGSGTGTGSTSTTTSLLTGSYRASGLLFGFVAAGGLGMLLLGQLVLFLAWISLRAVIERVRQRKVTIRDQRAAGLGLSPAPKGN